MKILRCLLCKCELDIINDNRSDKIKVKCRNVNCDFDNLDEQKMPEVYVIKKKKN